MNDATVVFGVTVDLTGTAFASVIFAFTPAPALAFAGDTFGPLGFTTGAVDSIELRLVAFMFGVVEDFAFNQNINNWDTSKVTNMSNMFPHTKAFNQPVGSWNTSKVTDMRYMFYNASAFNQNLTTWNIVLVTNHDNFRASASAWVS